MVPLSSARFSASCSTATTPQQSSVPQPLPFFRSFNLDAAVKSLSDLLSQDHSALYRPRSPNSVHVITSSFKGFVPILNCTDSPQTQPHDHAKPLSLRYPFGFNTVSSQKLGWKLGLRAFRNGCRSFECWGLARGVAGLDPSILIEPLTIRPWLYTLRHETEDHSFPKSG